MSNKNGNTQYNDIESHHNHSPKQSNVMSDRDPLIKNDNSFEGGFFRGLLQPCLAELVGVALFVFVGTACVHNGNIFGIAITHGFAIAVLVTATAPISGGHLNPAVTLSIFLSGGISLLKGLCYIMAQLLGSILGAALTRGILNKGAYEQINGGAHLLPDTTAVGQGILCEMVITSLLVLTVLLTAVDDEWKTPMGPLSIGLAVVVGILAGGSISGGSMNPARSFGPAVVDSSLQDAQWDYHHVYWIGPLTGSAIITLIYRLILAGPTKSIVNF